MNNLLEIVRQPWPWYVAGPMITLVMFLLLRAGGQFGVSSTLRSLCTIGGAGKNVPFFDFDWKSQQWNLVFVLGSIIGGYIANTVLANPEPLALAEATISDLANLGIEFDGKLDPLQLFSWDSLLSIQGIVMIIIGGFLVGFGARYAGGCTSGHAISGLSNLQIPSLIAVIGFFIGGLFITYIIYPILFH